MVEAKEPKKKDVENKDSIEKKEVESADVAKENNEKDKVDSHEEVIVTDELSEESDGLQFKDCEELQKKNKNLIAIIVLLSGVAIGSFFVDIAQLFTQRGFSAKALEDAQVVEYDGNTWVRYDDPKIVVEVFDADDCEDCVTDEVLVRLRSLIPTLEAHKINVRTEEGAKYAKENDIKHIPAFLFDDEIIESDFYQQAAILFKDNDNGKQYFEAPSVGVPIGEYLEAPTADTGIVLGNSDASAMIVLYDNFTAKESNVAYPIVEKIRSEQNENVAVIIKIVPDSEQKNSMNTALAMYCANDQEKYSEYAAILYKNHKNVTETDTIKDVLRSYAENTQMNVEQFDDCIGSVDAKEEIEKNILEASKFGVIAAPTFFINGEPHIGVITYQGLKEKIDAVIATSEKVVESE